jgi:hypothetical protein
MAAIKDGHILPKILHGIAIEFPPFLCRIAALAQLYRGMALQVRDHLTGNL